MLIWNPRSAKTLLVWLWCNDIVSRVILACSNSQQGHGFDA